MVNVGAWCCHDMPEGGKDGIELYEQKKRNTREYHTFSDSIGQNQNKDSANSNHIHHDSQCNTLSKKQGYIPTPRIYDSLPYQFRLPRAYFTSISHYSDALARIGRRDVKQRKMRSPLQKILYDSENSIRSTEAINLRQKKMNIFSSNKDFCRNYMKDEKDSEKGTDEKGILQRKDLGHTTSDLSENFITESENKLTNDYLEEPKSGETRNEVTYRFDEEDLFECPESEEVDVETMDKIDREDHYFEESGNNIVQLDATFCKDEEQILKNLSNEEAENNKKDNSSECDSLVGPKNQEVENNSTNYSGQGQVLVHCENQETELGATNPMDREQTYCEIQNQKVDIETTDKPDEF